MTANTVPTGPLTPAQELTAALAEWGITAHYDGDSQIGTSWLIIGDAEQDSAEFPDMERPYILAYAHTPDTEFEVFVDEPMTDTSRWHTVLGGGLESGALGHWGEIGGPDFPAADVAAVAEYIADWYTDMSIVRLTAELATLGAQDLDRAQVEELAFLQALLAACES